MHALTAINKQMKQEENRRIEKRILIYISSKCSKIYYQYMKRHFYA